jgi:meso-butanediol dehydrogenase/(S,S)-butanediol dehydrogenase/diacetyl reductase
VSGTLAGKVVVVTGATRGIGLAIARASAEAGASVAICSRHADAVEATVTALSANGARVTGIRCDVSRESDLEALLAHAVDAHGRVDVWFNNAGLSSGYRPLDELPPDEIREIVAVNLIGTALACRMLIPHFATGGVIVNLSGRGGRGDPTPHTAIYGATKAGVLSLTRSLAAENRRNSRLSIHALLPGMVMTDFYGPDMKVSPRLAESAVNIPLIIGAIGVPAADVGALAVRIAAQEPGHETGRVYRAADGPRMMVGGMKLAWWRLSGRMRAEP